MGIPVVLPALIPDIKKVYDVYFASFQNEGMARLMLDVMFPNGTVDLPGFREEHAKGTLAWWHQADMQYTFKCVDNETGETIGMALADILMRERTEEERKFGGIPWLEGKDRERAEAVVGPLAAMREKLFGGHKHVYCHVMGVVPEYQGRHAGRALLEFAIFTANQLCLPLYFESSPTTVGLYKKLGFEELPERIVHKAEVLGIEQDIEVPLMVRMPASAGELTFADWIASGYPSLRRSEKNLLTGRRWWVVVGVVSFTS
ncbi:uncharacterized protein B0I36DRAFT_395368 [Microdochium trichocladiopsis]|uniref:N-acetyltransferase domain-containing protein n=1 Tax=Microdochium trichocladiopsis TaxID=1682393 RepID=A0A9P8XV77_9PEZI|nr:uncharacterized protein B0I36DRAFT_395368 [Microdochium trichocladiopsis]KAH7018506.1 hypothetical protein B0I36DRAFT_395368 [Microdochium trichocladiopsis]